jgi:hypothetical protein
MRVLDTPADELETLINKLEREVKALKHEALKSMWFMRGSLNYDEAMSLSLEDRKIISDIIKDNLEASKKSGRDFF